MKTFIYILLTGMASLFFSGCGSQHAAGPGAGYETLSDPPNRDTSLARAHNAAALQQLHDDNLDGAEKQLKEALAADMFYGPAHNNLGTVYFKQNKYYLAAWEFQYAVKLMPGQVEPLNNLGLVFEKVGRLNDAEEWYDKALSLKPESAEVIGNLARIRIRSNRKDKTTRELLTQIIMKDKRPQWVSWAREQLAFSCETSADSPMPRSGKIQTLSDELE
ncbi:MAG: tetratricopeptide repeat protein [Phycisphaerae bacterium]|nr:tetratricopeptide repeat protein [Phycisphaerae bacterium]